MSYDPGCKVYWCDVDGCGGEMTLDCGRSMDSSVVLTCGRCGYQRQFDAVFTISVTKSKLYVADYSVTTSEASEVPHAPD